jgi:lipoyl(octanoyl) transferase
VQDLKKTTESKYINRATPLEFKYLGLVEYSKAYQFQIEALEHAVNNKKYTIIGLQHPAVLTLGHRASADVEILNQNSIQVEKTNRGGLATIHSEGQLVIYPILNIRELKIGVRSYIQLLLKTTQQVLQQLSVESFADDEAIGLYTAKGKIVFCGVQIKNGCSLHGISLNVSNDLELFQNIRSCGVKLPQLDKVSNYTNQINPQTLFEKWSEQFIRNLNKD